MLGDDADRELADRSGSPPAIISCVSTIVGQPRIRRDLHDRLTPWLLAAVPFVTTLVATRQGPGLSPDSVIYLSTGINVADGDGLRTLTGEALTLFPPGLPLLVAAGESLGLGADLTVRLANAAAFSGIVLIAAALLRRHVANRTLVTGGTLFVAVSVPLLGVAVMAWTEILFILVVLGFLEMLERALGPTSQRRWLAGCVAATWLAFSLRYAAICLVPVGVAAALAGTWRTRRQTALRDAVTFGVLALCVPALMMLRNHSTDGTLLGPRFPSIDTPAQVAERLLRTLGEWVLPLPLPDHLLSTIGLGLITGLIVTFVAMSRQATSERASDDAHVLLPAAMFTICYAIYLSLAQLTTAIDKINTRLLSPIFVPMLLLVVVALDKLAPGANPRCRMVARLALTATLAVQAVAYTNTAVRAGRDGEGYATSVWQQSELAAAVRDLPASAVVYSNDHLAIWAATHRQPVSPSGSLRVQRNTNEIVAIPTSFQADAECRETYLAWYDAYRNYNLSAPEYLTRVITVVPTSRHRDGTLYRLGPLTEPNCAAE